MSALRFDSFDALEAHLRSLALKNAIVAIDGLPCAGKSTLAARLHENLSWDLLELDDFTRPAPAWRAGAKPAFPFPFFRHDEAERCLRALRDGGACAYRAIDWDRDAIAEEDTAVTMGGPLIVEGVAALAPWLCQLYDLRIFVESDRASAFDAIFARDGRAWEDTWRTIVMPSDDLYFATRPQDRADIIVQGRTP